MSSTSKIITAIIIAAIIIGGAIVWVGQNSNTNQVSNTNTTPPPAENLPANTPPPAAVVPSPVAPSPTPPPAPVNFDQAIPTGSWVIGKVTLDNKAANLNVNVEQPLTLQFNTKTKKVSGFAGCNSFSSSYTASSDNKFSFGVLSATKLACQASALENSIFLAMKNVSNWSIKGDQLVLSNTNSSTELVYDQAK